MANTKKMPAKTSDGKRNSNRRHYTYRKASKKSDVVPKKQKEKIKISFLGGMNEIGKNMTLYEYANDMFIVDCGLAFPNADLPGVDLVIPDFSHVIHNKDKIKGVIITHGHEDHIGGLAYLLKEVNIPVYATKLTIGLIKGKLEEHGLLSSVKLVEIKPGDNITLGHFNIELIHVNHSIPDSVGLSVRCPAGIIIQTGDFKIDTTPVDGDMIDLPRFAEYGKKGVLALLSDSTNAERPGTTMSESSVGESFEMLFRKAKKKRIIVATFASNIHRIQQIMDVAQARGRKVAVVGRSLENLVQVGTELGYLNIPENTLISVERIRHYADEKLVIITTGSQGEPMSALTKISQGEHRKVSITPNDYVIISATPIPGNEKMVGNVVNALIKRDVEVIYENMYDVHVSGHACQQDLKLMIGLVKPKFFIPVHGEQKHLVKHASLALAMGIPADNIYVGDIGDTVEISEDGIAKVGSVPSGEIYVDGYGVGDVGNIVLGDRKRLSQDGIIIVTGAVDCASGELIGGFDIVSRGFVFVKENEDLISEAKALADKVYARNYRKSHNDWNTLKTKMRDEISQLMYERTKRSPMILPIFIEV